MLYDVEKRYKLIKEDVIVIFKNEKAALNTLSTNEKFKEYILETQDCLVCNIMKDKVYDPYDCLYLVNLIVEGKYVELWIEGYYGEVFIVIHEYMRNKSYQIMSMYEYGYCNGNMSYVYEEDIPNCFALSLLEYLNDNNAGVIAFLIENIDLDITNERQLLESEKMWNRSDGKYLYDYHVENDKPIFTAKGIQDNLRNLTGYFITESINMTFGWMHLIFLMQDRVRNSKDIDEILYLSAKLHYYLRCPVKYPYTYYKMVKEGKFDMLRLVKNTYV